MIIDDDRGTSKKFDECWKQIFANDSEKENSSSVSQIQTWSERLHKMVSQALPDNIECYFGDNLTCQNYKH